MKLAQLMGERFKEKPADCIVESHALLLRGGYMKQVANGIYSQTLPLRRICQKIKAILRQEMDAVDGQEVLFPVALPATLWQQSGRYETVGSELLRFEDRTGTPFVLGMTHEEAAVHLVQEYGNTYTRYPFMVYQIQTKFRDEGRPRAGLIRVREFIMKDAYSFHTSQQNLEEYYQRCFAAYHRIFARVGLPQVVDVLSDSGMMGGNVSHEYMLLTPAGEDSIACCPACAYRANLETTPVLAAAQKKQTSAPLERVHTPNASTIEEICAFLHISVEDTCKAVAYQKPNGEIILAFIRGDFEVNLPKLEKLVGEALLVANLSHSPTLATGYLGPVNLPQGVTALFDSTLKNTTNLVCGANETEHHYTGLSMARDIKNTTYFDFAKAKEDCLCPACQNAALTIQRGIEVGNIFQLGTHYTEKMGMEYTNEQGENQYPFMGCYGIGVGRLAASVCEASHDENGPIWPVSIAPWQVHICCVRADDVPCKTYADALYQTLQKSGVEVLYDDRNVRAGVQFADADLLGVPVRVIISPRNHKEGMCEITTRDKSIQNHVLLEQAPAAILQLLQSLQQDITNKVPL